MLSFDPTSFLPVLLDLVFSGVCFSFKAVVQLMYASFKSGTVTCK